MKRGIAALLPTLKTVQLLRFGIFLDGDKAKYGALLHPLLDLLCPGGVMVVDDVFFSGDALNPEPTTDKGVVVRELLGKSFESLAIWNV